MVNNTKACRVNNRLYTFGSEEGAWDWVCSKVPDNGRIKKDCVPKVLISLFCCVLSVEMQRDAPPWYKHLLDNRDYQVGGPAD